MRKPLNIIRSYSSITIYLMISWVAFKRWLLHKRDCSLESSSSLLLASSLMQICELMSPNYEMFPCYYYKGCSSSVHQPANLLKVMAAATDILKERPFSPIKWNRSRPKPSENYVNLKITERDIVERSIRHTRESLFYLASQPIGKGAKNFRQIFTS